MSDLDRREPRLSNDRGRSRSRSPSPERNDERRYYRSPSRTKSNDNADSNPGDNLYVTGLSRDTKLTTLETFFQEIGKVIKTEIMYDPHSRESRGFAFIQMGSIDEADRAIERLNQKELDGRVITVEKAKRGNARTPTPGRYFGPPKNDRDRGMRERPRYRPFDRRDDPYERDRYYYSRPPRYAPYERRYEERGPRYDDYHYNRGPPPSRYEEPRRSPPAYHRRSPSYHRPPYRSRSPY